jgi:arsenate reductase
MKNFTIYHNPRCSKSRETLALLQQHGIDPEVILYLETPPTARELSAIISKLGIDARDLLRTSESEYKSLNLSDTSLSQDAIIEVMASHPRLIERPIVISESSAVIGRPPANILALLR